MQSILPRLPICLISLGLSKRNEKIRKEFSYIPLALYFRKLRVDATGLTHTTLYTSREGVNITIAPRLELMIQMAFCMRSLSDHHQLFVCCGYCIGMQRRFSRKETKRPIDL